MESSSLPHARTTHSLQAELFVSLQDQLQSTHCIYCRFDSHFHRSFITVLITLANNDLFSIIFQSGIAGSRNRYLLGGTKKFEVLWRNFEKTSKEL
jgi:hypothetical protein